jgi:hypothetical protein
MKSQETEAQTGTAEPVASTELFGSVVLVLAEPRILNEAWGGMSAAMYRRAVAETPRWKIWLSLIFPLEHPYCKYTRLDSRHATHYCEDDQKPWIAVDMDRARELLAEHDLTDEEKTDIGALMAGYCRVLDDMGLIGYGQTEAEAILNANNKISHE